MSTLIAAALGLQAFISLALPPIYPKKVTATWPFINYPMYSDARKEGAPLVDRVIIGVRADGSEIELSRSDLPMNHWFYNIFHGAISRGDAKIVHAYLGLDLFQTPELSFTRLRVVERGSTFYINRLVPIPEREVAVFEIQSAAGGGQ